MLDQPTQNSTADPASKRPWTTPRIILGEIDDTAKDFATTESTNIEATFGPS